jgi:hypothetical protein
MKLLILILAAITSGIYIRIETTNIGKNMYVFGCSDSVVKLKKLNQSKSAEKLEKFCQARKKALDEYVNPFDI